MADRLSVALSFEGNEDERVEEAVEKEYGKNKWLQDLQNLKRYFRVLKISML